MIRQGKYTKPVPRLTRIRQSVHRRWVWFKGLSKRKKALIITGPVLLFLILTPPLTYLYFARDIANADRLMNHNNTGVVLLDRNGEVIYSFGTAERGKRVPLSQIADSAEKAVVSAEDKNFYSHPGFSFKSIIAAMYANVANKDATAYGGSTLTQQLAKNTLLSSDQNFLRKYQELSIAIAIEQYYSKDEILDMYLNSVYFGEGAFGIESAAKKYFNKSAADLSLAESAMLIGLLPAPSAYSPISGDPALAKKEQERVLKRMVADNVITEAEKNAALAQPLSYAEVKPADSDKAPHFSAMVLDELNKKYGEERVTRSGYKVYTTLDLKHQQTAQAAMDAQMPYIKSGGGSNASMIAMDPKNGEVIVLIGSADWNNPEFGKVNMATTPRQPGSSFKPIYYTQALQDGIITPATIIKDESTVFPGGYKPENFDFRYRGDITVRNALGQSLNIPSVKIMQKMGVDKAVAAAQRLGLTTVGDPGKYGLSLALGSAEVKLTDMATAYGSFANSGEQNKLTMIRSIDDKYNKRIFTNKPSKKRVMSEGATYLISKILSDQAAKAPSFGSKLSIPGYDVAAKSGTTDNQRDAWLMGYTPNLVVGAWVGNNNYDVMKYGGANMAGPMWRTVMRDILSDSPKQSFVQPSSVVSQLVCRSNGLIANRYGAGVYSEYFIKGKTPQGSCNVPVEKKEEAKPKNEEKKREEDTTVTPPTEPAAPAPPTPPTDPVPPNTDTGTGGTPTQPGAGTGTGDGTNTTSPQSTPGQGGGVQSGPGTTDSTQPQPAG